MDGRNTPYNFTRATRPTRQSFNLKRWYKGKRDVSTWDGLRRDIELFEDGADCSVFLYAKGQSQRGPAFRFPRRKLVEASCNQLLAQASSVPGSDKQAQSGQIELYLPAPSGLLRAEALKCHIATRNFFAWLCRKPLVGHFLGDALADTLEKMNTWRSASTENIEDILIYSDQMGYTAVEHRPDNALAMLAFAEKARLAHVWIDSFAHCTGMNDEIGRSCEFDSISRATKALITRAFLEMNLHLDRASKAVVSFLENELSASYLGLSDGARQHLDNFRSFLHTYHVGKYGYWPPHNPSNYPKELYYDLYYDFSCLYHFLADKSPATNKHSSRPVNGGICVQQNIEQFDTRHKFNPLPYAIPLVPQPSQSMKSQKSLRSFKLGRDINATRAGRAEQTRQLLREASNETDTSAMHSPLVQRYIGWEDLYATQGDEDVSVVDARKVRWILIYGVLQTLVSAIQAPPEVRDTTSARYPLCILTNGLPPWDEDPAWLQQQQQRAPSVTERSEPDSTDNEHVSRESAPTPTYSIEPDCEGQTYFEYWSNSNSSSESQNNQTIKPLRRASTKLRKASFKRRSLLQQAQSNIASQPELVSGRTLAELAYGETSTMSLTDSDFHGFDFGFDHQPKQDESRLSTDTVGSLPDSPTIFNNSTTFDDFQDSLAAQISVTNLQDPSDTASIPSLTHSHGSRDTVDSFHSTEGHFAETKDLMHRSNSTDSNKSALTDEADEKGYFDLNKPATSGEPESPNFDTFSTHVVNSFTDFYKKEFDSGSSSPGSIDSHGYDRGLIIENDGLLNESITV